MAARDSDTKADAGNAGEGSKAKGGGTRGRASPEAVTRAMAEVEKTLERLKQLRAERAEVEKRFLSDIAEREQQLASLRTERDEALDRLSQAEDRIAKLEKGVTRSRGAEDQRDEALEKLEAVEKRLGELGAALEAERAGRQAAESKLAEAEAGVRAQTEALREQLAQAEERERVLGDAREKERQAADATIRELRERVEAAEGAAGEQLAEMRCKVESLQTLAAEAEQRAAEAASRIADEAAGAEEARAMIAELQASVRSLEERASRAETQAAELGASLEQASGGARALEGEVLTLRQQLAAAEQERAELDRKAAEARGALDAAAADADRRVQEAHSQAESVLGRVSELEAALAARSSEAQEATQNASILSGKVSEQQGELERAKSELETLRAELERRERESTELLEALEEAEQSARSNAESCERAAAELEAERDQVREMGEKLDLAADRLVEMQTELDLYAGERAGEEHEAVLGLTRELQEARSALARTERERDAALAGRGSAGGGDGAGDGARSALRRERLRRCRRLLRERVAHSARATQVLEHKLQTCDEILARRRELVEARQIIERTHKKVVSGRAKPVAGAVVFFGLATVAVLAALSWAIVTRVFPATYAASAVISADFQGQPAKPGELEAWQKFHEEHLLDAALMSRVAERMGQRGFEDLSQPAVVKTMLESDMTYSSPQPGVLAIELRGLGQEATTRKLDAYVTTLTVEANALRQRRSDSSVTVISERPRAGAEPIEDGRLEYAGMGVGVGSLFCALLWFGIWRRMVRTKQAFEHETEIEGLLEEARWVDPIQRLMEQAEGAGGRAA